MSYIDTNTKLGKSDENKPLISEAKKYIKEHQLNQYLPYFISSEGTDAFYNKDYKIWDTVKQYLPYLSSAYDSVHKKIWVNSQKPSGGILNNWTEPYNYVEYVMYYYEQYKKFLPGNLPEETKKKNRRK